MNAPIEIFIQYIKTINGINVEAEKDLQNICQVHKFPKKHLFLKDGQVCHRLYFVTKGTARTYYDVDGKDVTSWFYIEGQMMTSWYSFLNRVPAFEAIESLEETEVVSISYEELESLYQKHPSLERFGRKMLEKQLAFIDFFSKGYMFMSAKDRYNLLLSIYPDLLQRVKLGHVASFLGISQETLSRIRARK